MAKKINLNSGVISSILSVVLIFAIILAVAYFYINIMAPTKVSPLKISTEEARARRFGLIIDLRTPKERSVYGYYPNSIPISLDKLVSDVPTLITSKKTHILVYSNGDDRAQKAATLLNKMGYINARFINTTYQKLMPGYQ